VAGLGAIPRGPLPTALPGRLLRSLEGISEAENERLWLAEAERRLLEIHSGQVEALPGEEILRRAAAEIS